MVDCWDMSERLWSMAKNKRPQRQKEYVEHVQNLRRGSTTARHKSAKDYRRKPKHVNRSFD